MVKRPTPRLDSLFARVRRLTAPRGAKGLLADSLGIEASRLSEWLRGDYEPSGEITLQLLEWVTAAEAKQKEPSGALTPKGRKTRSAKSKANEKVQPDRPKG